MATEQAVTAGFEIVGSAGKYLLSGSAGYPNARRILEDGRRCFGAEANAEIDLGGLTALDSAGLAVLLAWLGEAHTAGRELAYRGLPAALLPTARVAGVDGLIGAARR